MQRLIQVDGASFRRSGQFRLRVVPWICRGWWTPCGSSTFCRILPMAFSGSETPRPVSKDVAKDLALGMLWDVLPRL